MKRQLALLGPIFLSMAAGMAVSEAVSYYHERAEIARSQTDDGQPAPAVARVERLQDAVN